MRRISIKRKGFTLVEMVLVLAITLLIGSVVAGVCLAVSNSFITTYNIDDSSDYAMLYAKGFENSFLTYTQADGVVGSSWKWYIANPGGKSGNIPTLTRQKTTDATSAEAVFNPTNMNSASGENSKWAVAMFYKYDEDTACVNYRIFVRDNYSNTNYVSRYDGCFWIPRIEECADYDGVGGARAVELAGEPLSATLLGSEKYGFTPAQCTQIAAGIDSEYKEEIIFTWG